ncbi:hypothetical protein [Allopusillimonas ginsengisoli]|uniref:hypothetical protein n=1 Tax=Allopusillimonas ginsengisoli TaxID=453575 RepID=UPI00101F8AA4|nr:hypothetical protein [Allopusillimonas ginsengisoli]TEA78640.1 hypothetical protein ERE07_09595 [Allopusillimonas ginsengisoli]
MKISADPRLPIDGGISPSLNVRLYELFRSIAASVNGLAEGRIMAVYNAATEPPTTGEHYQGDFIRNREPVDAGGYIVTGWICVESGSPGTWKECRCATV